MVKSSLARLSLAHLKGQDLVRIARPIVSTPALIILVRTRKRDKLSGFAMHSETEPFDIKYDFNHLNTGHIQRSDLDCYALRGMGFP